MKYVFSPKYVDAYTHTRTHTRAHTRTHTHTHTHTQRTIDALSFRGKSRLIFNLKVRLLIELRIVFPR